MLLYPNPALAQPESNTPRTDPLNTETNDDFSDLEEITISGRLPIRSVGQKVTLVDLDATPFSRLDDILGAVPGVRLFRRANSLSANPTIQGLTMRGVGGNAAGRVLVTLDGVPLNDPFGGWINWASLAPETLISARVQAGGGAGAFGAQALAGSVALESAGIEENAGYGRFSIGSFATTELAGGLTLANAKADTGGFRLDAGTFESDGFPLLDEADQGPIDRGAASSITRVSGQMDQKIAGSRVVLSARYFDETRLNGFENAPNSTEGLDTSIRILSNHGPVLQSEVLLYTRLRTLKNSFVSARDNRSIGRPVLDQTSVPGDGYGFLVRVQSGPVELGMDGQWLVGSTDENYRNLGAGFTRRRQAGGEQGLLGTYLQWDWAFNQLKIASVIRLDGHTTAFGRRQETDLASADILLNTKFPSQSGLVPTGRLAANYRLTPAINFSGNFYRSWRLPTLNEFYRPFRVGNDITEANAALRPEKLWGLDISATYQPLTTIRLRGTYFRSWLQDGVGNITLAFGPGFFTPGGFVPAGGVLRQRTPVDLVVTDGIELDGQIDLANGFSLVGRYQWTAARLAAFAGDPSLIGNRPIQTPVHSLMGRLAYQGQKLFCAVEGRYQSSLYDDDQNLRRLPDALTLNLQVSYRLNDGPFTLEASVENLLDERVVSAENAAGLQTLAMPRFLRGGIRFAF